MLTREEITAALRGTTEPLDYVNAMWEGGGIAFGRIDDYSDIDVLFDCAEGRTDDTVAAIEGALSTLGEVDYRWELPRPTWHGMYQCFYRLKSSSPFLFIDMCVREPEQRDSLSEVEHHGEPVVYFDKVGAITTTTLDPGKLRESLLKNLAGKRGMLPMVRALVMKEVHRDKPLDALHYYQNYVIRPLASLARIRHCPTREPFGLRYAEYDLPVDICDRLKRLAYVADIAELADKLNDALSWSGELLAEIEAEGLAL